MKSSLKQLMRTPIKAILFFLLMAAGSMLLVFGSVMLVQSMQRISAAEKQFATIGTVEQKPSATRNEMITWNKSVPRPYVNKINEYKEILPTNILNFEGANYRNPPEHRPYYEAYLPQYSTTSDLSAQRSTYIVEFTPIVNCVASQYIEVKITDILLNRETGYDKGRRQLVGIKNSLEPGDIISIYDPSVLCEKVLMLLILRL